MSNAWPASLPSSLRANYTIDERDGRLITDMDQGPPRFRKRFENTPTQYQLTFIFNGSQLGIFRAFYRTTLNGGLDSVDMPILDEDGVNTVEVKLLTVGPALPNGDLFTLSIMAITV